MSTLIMKFGGSSVDTTSALTQVLSIVLHEHKRWDQLVLVASALGGVTDSLIEAAHLAQLNNRRGYRRIVATIRTRHIALAEYLPLGQTERNTLLADIDRLLFDMLDICQALSDTPTDVIAPETIDSIIGVGERLSARIIAAILRQNNLRGVAIDATDLIVTDDTYGNAVPNMALTRDRIKQNLLPMLDRKIIPVVTGFVGATASGKPTTLGRGGSDYSAAILAVCTNATEVWIWTSVDGMMTGDPHEIPEAKTIPELSYEEVSELAHFGARILHPRMIEPLRERGIPFRIKNVFKPQLAGTYIHNAPTASDKVVKAVTAIQGISLLTGHTTPLSTITYQADQALMEAIGNHAEVMISSQSSSSSFICFVIPTSAGIEAIKTTQQILESSLTQDRESSTWDIQPVSIITVIGKRLNILSDFTARVLQILQEIPILALSLGPSGNHLSIVIKMHDRDEALQRIHDFIVNNGPDNDPAPRA